MRDEFYGDRKDVVKWTFALRAAGDKSRILYVMMYRANKGRHGQDFRPVADCQPSLAQFFDSERVKFRAGITRRVAGVRALAPGRIQVVAEGYEHRRRYEYFEKVRGKLRNRPAGDNFVVLLDPDNGIAGVTPKNEHVCAQQLSATWSELKPADALLIYQHQFRDKEWRAKRRSSLAAAIGVAQGRIQQRCAADVGDVCFFEVVKEDSDLDSPYHPCD